MRFTGDKTSGDDRAAPRPEGARAPRLPYMPGVDGLRALAVASVVAYHAGATWLPGGFLGVDVFLVISGYLITSLLLAEMRQTGRIDLIRFWLRRARRLLPAVFVMIAVVLVVMLVLHTDEVGRLRGAVLSSLLYVTNWYQIVAEQSYFAEFARPSVFQHLWSLAVEEQFYLLWPPILAGGMMIAGRRRLLLGVVLGIAGSTVLAWVLFDPEADPSRIYYGTDTRMAGLLVGVALAFVWPAARLRPVEGRGPRALLDGAGIAALGGLVALMLTVGEFDRRLYQGGFLMVAVVTAVLLAVVAHPSTRLGRAFALAPMVWIGQRSYGIYLWHWPVIMLTRPRTDVPFDGPALTAMQIALTVGIAALSYRFVETPIRRHGLGPVVAAFRGEPGGWRRRVPAMVGALAACALVVAVTVVPAKDPVIPGLTDTASARGAAPPVVAGPQHPSVRTKKRYWVVAVGDSVMLGASGALKERFGRRLVLDAEVGRQVDEGARLAVVDAVTRRPAAVVVHLGSNGDAQEPDLVAMLDRLRDVPVVVLVTVRVDKPWEGEVNDVIARVAEGRPNVVIADWHGFSEDHLDWFVDGAHTTADGARAYARLIDDAIAIGRA